MRASRVAAALAVATFVLTATGSTQPVAPKLAAPAASAAQKAPVATVLILDRATVLNQSLAGKSMYAQFNALMDKMEADLAPEGKKLNADLDALEAMPASSAQREAKIKAVQARRTALEQSMQDRRSAIQAAVRKARAQLEQALKPVLEKIMVEREAVLLLDRGLVIRGGVDADVTALVIQRLNAAVPKIDVTPTVPATTPSSAKHP
jgi:Skp family chaperone for outer membrane proteins